MAIVMTTGFVVHGQGSMDHPCTGALKACGRRISATLRIRFAFAADKVLRKGEQTVRVSMQVEGHRHI